MLKKRILTALIALPLLIVAILYLKPVWFAAISGVLMLLGAWEWSALVGFSNKLLRAVYVIAVAIGIAFAAFSPVFPMLFVASLLWVWALVAVLDYQRNGVGFGFQFPPVRSLIGFIVLVSTWVALMTLRTHAGLGSHWLIFALILIFAADVGGYFAGRFFGKHALCSRVSPKKTWEGFAGGFVLSLLCAIAGGLFFKLSLHAFLHLLVFSALVMVFSVIGDLSVSLLKRMINIKDSGQLFPGHGGMLDRLDSVASGVVIFVFCYLWVGL